MIHLDRVQVGLESEMDKRVWQPSPLECFTVQSMYNILKKPMGLLAPVQEIWRVKVPSNASFLPWLLHFDKALTLDNLEKKGFQLANRCSLCRKSEESVAHLFLHCHMASELWGEFL